MLANGTGKGMGEVEEEVAKEFQGRGRVGDKWVDHLG